jgi:hypothetical protein
LGRKFQVDGARLNFVLSDEPSRRQSGPSNRQEKGNKEDHLLRLAPAQLEKPLQE